MAEYDLGVGEFVNIAESILNFMKYENLSMDDISYITVKDVGKYYTKGIYYTDYEKDESGRKEYLVKDIQKFFSSAERCQNNADFAIPFCIYFKDETRFIYEPDSDFYGMNICIISKPHPPVETKEIGNSMIRDDWYELVLDDLKMKSDHDELLKNAFSRGFIKDLIKEYLITDYKGFKEEDFPE